MTGIFDSHAHYFDARFEREVDGGSEAILSEILPSPVSHILNVGTDLRTSALAIEQAARYDGMYAAIGSHPGDGHYLPNAEEAIDALAKMLGDEKSRKELRRRGSRKKA